MTSKALNDQDGNKWRASWRLLIGVPWLGHVGSETPVTAGVAEACVFAAPTESETVADGVAGDNIPTAEDVREKVRVIKILWCDELNWH